MDEKALMAEEFEVKGYLSKAQIEIVKSKSDSAQDPSSQKEVVTLIDQFVESNGKSSPEYQALKQAVGDSLNLLQPHFNFSATVKEVLPAAFMFSYYSFLVLVGVVSEADIFAMQEKALALAAGKFPSTPKA